MVEPAATVMIDKPVFCCVPAPDPYRVLSTGAPFTNSVNWLGSTVEADQFTTYVPAFVSVVIGLPGVCKMPAVIGPFASKSMLSLTATTSAVLL